MLLGYVVLVGFFASQCFFTEREKVKLKWNGGPASPASINISWLGSRVGTQGGDAGMEAELAAWVGSQDGIGRTKTFKRPCFMCDRAHFVSLNIHATRCSHHHTL